MVDFDESRLLRGFIEDLKKTLYDSGLRIGVDDQLCEISLPHIRGKLDIVVKTC